MTGGPADEWVFGVLPPHVPPRRTDGRRQRPGRWWRRRRSPRRRASAGRPGVAVQRRGRVQRLRGRHQPVAATSPRRSGAAERVEALDRRRTRRTAGRSSRTSSRRARGRARSRVAHDRERLPSIARWKVSATIRAPTPRAGRRSARPRAGRRTTAASASASASFSAAVRWSSSAPPLPSRICALVSGGHVDALALERAAATICWPLASLTMLARVRLRKARLRRRSSTGIDGRAAERARRQVLQRVGEPGVDPHRVVDVPLRARRAPGGRPPGSRTSAASRRSSCWAAGARRRGRRRAPEKSNM